MPQSPEPHFTSTIPSIHDDTTLDFRLYHPDILSKPQLGDSETEQQWIKKGIVIAHPYAPMGGCYDDRVVGIVVDEFLRAGWVVGTFNFRGAHGSKGRTSWSGKPELDDYTSFAAFFMHYMSYLQPHPPPDAVFTPDQSPTSPQARSRDDALQEQAQAPAEGSPIVILGGYSYGSLILKHLPPVPSILQPFAAPTPNSTADEILLRAHKIADQSNLEWITLARDHARQKHTITMGGDEMIREKGRRRSSSIREIKWGIDGKGLDLGHRLRAIRHRKRDDNSQTPPESTLARPSIIMPHIRYLLISPLTTPVSTLAAPGLVDKFWSRGPQRSQEVVAKHETLAIYGDQDVFTSAKKVRDWTERLQSESGFRFWGMEIKGAGHFWHEHGVERELRMALVRWEARVRESRIG